MSAWVGRALSASGLVAVYLLTLGRFSWGDLAIGLLLAGLVESGWRRRLARAGGVGSGAGSRTPWPPLHRMLLALPALIWAVLVEITRGTWEVAQCSLGLREPDDEGIVEIELEGVSEVGVAAWAYISTISPGEIVVELDEARGVLILHAIEVGDPVAARARHKEMYERYQRKVVP